MKRQVTALDVRCAACGACAGERCRSMPRPGQQQVPTTLPHETRRRRAREENARLDPEHVHGQLDLFPARDARR